MPWLVAPAFKVLLRFHSGEQSGEKALCQNEVILFSWMISGKIASVGEHMLPGFGNLVTSQHSSTWSSQAEGIVMKNRRKGQRASAIDVVTQKLNTLFRERIEAFIAKRKRYNDELATDLEAPYAAYSSELVRPLLVDEKDTDKERPRPAPRQTRKASSATRQPKKKRRATTTNKSSKDMLSIKELQPHVEDEILTFNCGEFTSPEVTDKLIARGVKADRSRVGWILRNHSALTAHGRKKLAGQKGPPTTIYTLTVSERASSENESGGTRDTSGASDDVEESSDDISNGNQPVEAASGAARDVL